MNRQTMLRLAACVSLCGGVSAYAHSPWLAIGDDGKAILFFGETHAERTYHMPEKIAAAKVELLDAEGKKTPVALEKVESDKLVGMTSADQVEKDSTLVARATYGIYHGSRLDYYTVHQGGKLPKSLDAYAKRDLGLDLQANLVDSETGVDVYVLWKGKPLANADVKLFCDDGHEEGAAKTDESGKVSFSDREVEDGLNGIVVGHTIDGEAGQLDGKDYQSASHYLSVTFLDPQDFEKSE